MRRIYIESLVSLIVLFFGSLVSYSFIVYELDTDYDTYWKIIRQKPYRLY